MPELKTKLHNIKSTSIDDKNKTVVFRISDGKPDRHGEIVDQKSWDFTDYMQNPLLILNHDSSDISNGVGQAEELWYDADDDATYGRFKVMTEVSEKAALAWKLIKAGILRTVSVGFIPDDIEWTDDGTPILKNNKLLETSLVLVPANPRAVALGIKSGLLTRKDAGYIQESMRKELEFIDQQLKSEDAPEGQEKQVEEVISKLDKALEAIEETSTKLAELDTKFESVSTELETIKSTVGEVKAKQEETPTPPAKGGDDDQPGAGAEVEIDEDAELTPEQQAEFEAELAEQLTEGDSEE
ncbi:peptidase U35 phage prohead HK97 [Rhodococcus rhodochrous ATCC 21198]|nr:HK97 family phage prohead protease [Rhodococcus aetherivorans]ETT25254.1 peptidase U35 phage prohead HK97 [Rhodococcus rhodochrous ATCC 21198]MDV6295192.1 HK97 family phage prohead protease [Rhodococcus aetherivorans]NGP28474.1 hypothetical protein [Rhodococcus aetherivorans]